MVDLALAGVLCHQDSKGGRLRFGRCGEYARTAVPSRFGIPGQVVVHHQVPALKVDAFAGGIGGYEDFDLFILSEGILGLPAFLTAHAAVDRDHGFWTP